MAGRSRWGERLIAKGENPKGFTAVTVNGTSKAMGTGWNGQWDWDAGQLDPTPVRPGGRTNRTGE